MKKNCIILFSYLILGAYNLCYGQNSLSIQADYTYTNYGTNQEYDLKLHIKDAKALTVFSPKKGENRVSVEDNAEGISFNKQYNDEIGKRVFIDAKQKQIVFRDFVYDGEDKAVIVSENIPDYKWELKDEYKTIGSFNCYLAELSFRGRVYTVWYTPEVNTPFGPWKFYGLPGLIVSVNSKYNNIKMVLNKIYRSKNEEIKIIAPTQGEKITLVQYKEYIDNTVSEFVKKLKTKLPRGAIVTVNSTGEDYNLEKAFE